MTTEEQSKFSWERWLEACGRTTWDEWFRSELDTAVADALDEQATRHAVEKEQAVKEAYDKGRATFADALLECKMLAQAQQEAAVKEAVEAARQEEREACAKMLDEQAAHRERLMKQCPDNDPSWDETRMCHRDCARECQSMSRAIRRSTPERKEWRGRSCIDPGFFKAGLIATYDVNYRFQCSIGQGVAPWLEAT